MVSITSLRASFTKRDKLARERNSKTGCGSFCGWVTNNAQIKEHRCNISFTYRPMQYTKRKLEQSQIKNKEIKKPQYVEKYRRPKKWRVARSFDRAGIAWLLVEGSNYFNAKRRFALVQAVSKTGPNCNCGVIFFFLIRTQSPFYYILFKWHYWFSTILLLTIKSLD